MTAHEDANFDEDVYIDDAVDLLVAASQIPRPVVDAYVELTKCPTDQSSFDNLQDKLLEYGDEIEAITRKLRAFMDMRVARGSSRDQSMSGPAISCLPKPTLH